MTTQSVAATAAGGLFANPRYLRLWFAGGVGNAMRWLELLVAGIVTYDLTRSAFLVAAVTVARSLPMLFLGPLAGVVAEAFNRRLLLLGQLCVMATVSAALAALALSGGIRVWHLALAGGVAGTVWACEMAVRRRMLGEVVAADRIGAAVALDSLTNSIARVLGPLCGGILFEVLGLAGAYLVSATLYAAAFVAIRRLDFAQETRRLRLGGIPREIAEGLAVARRTPAILGVVLVTIVMNTFGFCYAALIAPIGLAVYHVSPSLVGALAAAEPSGAIVVGVALAGGWLRLDGGRALLRGSLLFLGGVIAMALSPWYGLAFALLVVGGLGTAVFANMQTSLILIEAPPAARSRVMGIITMCIGTGPLGVLAIGALSERVGPPTAVLVMASLGVAGLALVWRQVVRASA
ncbi:MAG: MFS transporter [Thiohalocapsa sp.]